MKRYLHWWITLLFALALLYDFAVWGALAGLPEIGPKLELSARRQALLATIYMSGGTALDAALPPLKDWGERRGEAALAEGFPRMREDPYVAMDLIFSQTWNAAHATLKFCYWAAPVAGLLALVAWVRRPKKIRLMGRR
jgi:hypothetical protein